ncbi:helix-turn-helix domain-containing protein [Streptomyces sp. YIM 130001]|uniref:winged helix-turn-helix transcriptional regulator n=1 Tax=Streptomyces sp. YIM 130001 TaxID=2259644 RepID=UPI001F09AA69|nr:helix-turn-helix domain-containing protein [Streptomyces sp. YIM 130001]
MGSPVVHESPGSSSVLLTPRLARLVENGPMEKVPYQEKPVRFEYLLTPKGRDLARAVIALMQWGGPESVLRGRPAAPGAVHRL